LTFVAALCALMNELLIARAVSVWVVSNAVWYALAVGIFIGGMGIGAWFAGSFRSGVPVWRRLWGIEAGLAGIGAMSVVLINAAGLSAGFFEQSGMPMVWGRVLLFGTAFVSALGIGVLAGMELPLLMQMADDSASDGQDRAAIVLALDYAGTLAAGLLFPLVVVPRMSLVAAALATGVLNAVLACSLLAGARSASGWKRQSILLAGLVLGLVFSSRLDSYFVSKYYFGFEDETAAQFFWPHEYPAHIQRLSSPYQQIDLVTVDDIGEAARAVASAFVRPAEKAEAYPEGLVFFLNRDFQFAAAFERIYHETFAHVPIALRPRVPQRVLILGGGDGLLLREVLKYPGLKQAVLVDIDPMVLSLFANDRQLSALNGHAFDDPRVTVIADDAFRFVQRSRQVFDMIYCDFPNPDDYDLSKLYSREFYAFARSRLAPGGWLVLDAPGLSAEMSGDVPKGFLTGPILSATLRAGGFKAVRPFVSDLGAEAPQGLVSGFMIAADEPLPARPRPLSVPGLRVLTDARVSLSLAPRGYVSDNASAVNSIFRPLFPRFSEWGRIRTAY
jgi:spermidine synthase